MKVTPGPVFTLKEKRDIRRYLLSEIGEPTLSITLKRDRQNIPRIITNLVRRAITAGHIKPEDLI